MARMFKGNVPHGAFLMEVSGDAAWALYRREVKGTFANVKLISMGPRAHKANFHLGFSIEHGKLTRARDARVLKKQCPEVFEWVVSILEEYYRAKV